MATNSIPAWGARPGSRRAVREALENSLPVGVDCVALCRPCRHPRTLWARLWDRVGMWLARRAGWEVVRAAAGSPPEHQNCRCATTEVGR